MNKTDLQEIKKGKDGYGLLVETDGYISLSEDRNKILRESMGDGDNWHCPYPFKVFAVLQKCDTENANGRIYPKAVLMKEAEKYQDLIRDRRSFGECYTPDTLILTAERGWQPLANVIEGEMILTLNKETKDIEIQPIKRVIKYNYEGKMIRIKGRSINDLVTPNHKYPIYNNFKYRGDFTAQELMLGTNIKINKDYIPKRGNWCEKGDDFFILKGLNTASKRLLKHHPDACEDKVIPMSTFMKFLGIYLSEGDYRKNSNDVNIYQKKENICEAIEEMLIELDLPYTINHRKINHDKVYRINDPRLRQFVEPLGNCYTKYIPSYFKNQSKENLRIFYDWYVMGDGRIRGDKRRKSGHLSDDVFSVSKQLVLDLNEIQLKIGYCGVFHEEERGKDRYFGDRVIKAKNSHNLFLTLRSLSNGIYISRYTQFSEENYNGDVMCVEVENHSWYCMCNNKCHWTCNCNHPSDSTINLSRVSHIITEMHWEGKTLVGELELNVSRGFVKNGIVTTCGDEAANLLLNGYKIGVSSRGVGSVENKFGKMIVGDDFELICVDIVATPSTPNAYIGTTPTELQGYIESKENKKPILSEKLEKIKKILK